MAVSDVRSPLESRNHSDCMSFLDRFRKRTEDDWAIQDGMIMKQSESANGGVGRSVSGVLRP